MLLHGATVTSRSNFETRLRRDDNGHLATVPGDTLTSRLLDEGARVVGVDARGHGGPGRSDDPDRYRGDAHARDVIAVIDALDVDNVHLVGYSMGSITSGRLIGLEHRLRSVVLGVTGPLHVEGHPTDLWDRLALAGRCLQADDFAAHPTLEYFRVFAGLDPFHDFASIGAALIGLQPTPPARLDAASIPVLVVNGGGDNPDDDVASLSAMIPGSRGAIAGTADHRTRPATIPSRLRSSASSAGNATPDRKRIRRSLFRHTMTSTYRQLCALKGREFDYSTNATLRRTLESDAKQPSSLPSARTAVTVRDVASVAVCLYFVRVVTMKSSNSPSAP